MLQVEAALSHLACKLQIAAKHVFVLGVKLQFLKERDNFLLPENAFVLLPEVDKRI